jgi:YegS/Rv2252/BmrU family lipid kinase
MRRKRVCLIINPRAGHNVAKLTELIAVFAAADWKIDIALKAYPGQVTQLAARAARRNYDLVIAYGGDGTINKVVNGVINARGHSVVGAIPGGTANEWAVEIGLPLDPMQAALTLVNSDARTIDLGLMQVERLTFPNGTRSQSHHRLALPRGKKVRKKSAQAPIGNKPRFLLMAGLGTDAAILPYISKTFKYEVGSHAFEVAAAKKLTELQPFPVEVSTVDDAGDTTLLWRGEAWQILIANARLYGSIVDIAPEAYLDDGKLDVCVLTVGNLFATMGQITSLLLRRKPDDETAEYFQAAQFSIRVPASIGMHLDGSLAKLKNFLSKADLEALQQTEDLSQVMVEYRFSVLPGAVQVAIPHTYDDTLFKKSPKEAPCTLSQTLKATLQRNNRFVEGQQVAPEFINALLETGLKVTVAGVAPNPATKGTIIIAGTLQNQKSGDVLPVAVPVDHNVVVTNRAGERVSAAAIQKLQEGAVVVLEGKKSKRGVIRANHIVI